MQIKVQAMGDYQTNCYIVSIDDKDFIIDPGVGATSWVEQNVKNPVAILNTHGHFDHIRGVQPFLDKGVPVYIHEAENLKCNGSVYPEYLKRFHIEPFNATDFVDDGDVLDFMDLQFTVITTPGHSAGSVCYVLEDWLFSGDTLFQGSYGRYDFEDGSLAQLRQSITTKLFKLKGDYNVIAGHGEDTTLDYERQHNAILYS